MLIFVFPFFFFLLFLWYSTYQLSFSFAEHVDIDEAKSIFESNYSHVYFILYDTFVQAETNLRQRGKLFRVQYDYI